MNRLERDPANFFRNIMPPRLRRHPNSPDQTSQITTGIGARAERVTLVDRSTSLRTDFPDIEKCIPPNNFDPRLPVLQP
jgi:hypothetical protein